MSWCAGELDLDSGKEAAASDERMTSGTLDSNVSLRAHRDRQSPSQESPD